MNAERRRLTFNVRLSEVVDALATLVSCTDPPGPLFVVSLDDVDLNPLRCLEALKLLHLLAVPRVFTIVLGDMDMVELALNLKHSGDFSALVGHHARENLTSLLDREVATRVGTLSSNTMRKLLPPAQRIRLGRMTLPGALNFRPFGERDHVPLLHGLLGRLPAAIGPVKVPRMDDRNIRSLRDLLLYPASPGLTDTTEITEEQLKTCTYTATQIFRMPPRSLADWWLFLKYLDDRYPYDPDVLKQPNDQCGEQKEPPEKWKQVVDLLALHCRTMIAEEPTLDPLNRRRFREGLRKNPVSDRWELSFAVSSIPEQGLRSVFNAQDDNVRYPFMKRYIVTHQGTGWRFHEDLENSPALPQTTVDPYELAEDVRKWLDQSFSLPTTCALMVLNNLICLGPYWEEGDKFWIRSPVALYSFAQWNIPGIKHIWIAWPVPDFLSFWGYDIFRNHWNTALKRILKIRHLYDEQASIEACVYAWLDSAAAVLVLETPLWDSIRNSKSQLEREDWSKLIDRLARPARKTQETPQSETSAASEEGESVLQVAAQMNPRGYSATDWLVRLAHFLWPAVSGIQRTTAAYFFENDNFRTFWKTHLRSIEKHVEDILNHPKAKEEQQRALHEEHVKMLEQDWNEYKKKISPTAAAYAKRTSEPEPPPSRPAKRPRRRE